MAGAISDAVYVTFVGIALASVTTPAALTGASIVAASGGVAAIMARTLEGSRTLLRGCRQSSPERSFRSTTLPQVNHS